MTSEPELSPKEKLAQGLIALPEYLKMTDTREALEIPIFTDTFYRLREGNGR